MEFKNEVLLSLSRKYSENEMMQLLIENNKKLQMQIGILKSELAEAYHKMKEIEKGFPQYAEYKKDEALRKLYSTVYGENKKLKKDLDYWQTKFIQLKNQIQNDNT